MGDDLSGRFKDAVVIQVPGVGQRVVGGVGAGAGQGDGVSFIPGVRAAGLGGGRCVADGDRGGVVAHPAVVIGDAQGDGVDTGRVPGGDDGLTGEVVAAVAVQVPVVGEDVGRHVCGRSRQGDGLHLDPGVGAAGVNVGGRQVVDGDLQRVYGLANLAAAIGRVGVVVVADAQGHDVNVIIGRGSIIGISPVDREAGGVFIEVDPVVVEVPGEGESVGSPRVAGGAGEVE